MIRFIHSFVRVCSYFLWCRVEGYALLSVSLAVASSVLFSITTIIYFESLLLLLFFACNSPFRQAAAGNIFLKIYRENRIERYGRKRSRARGSDQLPARMWQISQNGRWTRVNEPYEHMPGRLIVQPGESWRIDFRTGNDRALNIKFFKSTSGYRDGVTGARSRIRFAGLSALEWYFNQSSAKRSKPKRRSARHDAASQLSSELQRPNINDCLSTWRSLLHMVGRHFVVASKRNLLGRVG